MVRREGSRCTRQSLSGEVAGAAPGHCWAQNSPIAMPAVITPSTRNHMLCPQETPAALACLHAVCILLAVLAPPAQVSASCSSNPSPNGRNYCHDRQMLYLSVFTSSNAHIVADNTPVRDIRLPTHAAVLADLVHAQRPCRQKQHVVR